MKKQLSYGLLLICICTTAILATQFVKPAAAFPQGVSGFSDKGCIFCHSGGDVPTVTIQGPGSVKPGSTNVYQLIIEGGSAVSAGFNLSSKTGATLSTSDLDEYVKVLNGQLTHTQPKPFDGTKATFTFELTAPNSETELILAAAGNSTNNDGSTSGDASSNTTFKVVVANESVQLPTITPTPAVMKTATLVPVTVTKTATPTAEPTPVAADLTLSSIVTAGLNKPTAIVNAGDDRLFIAQQSGSIMIIENGKLRETPFLDLTNSDIFITGQAGLLGLAFHPNYAKNGQFFVHYIAGTDGALETRISRFQVSNDANVADLNSEEIVLQFDQPSADHNGADILFGPDGYLYISSGYGDSGNDVENYGQRTDVLLGKLLRIDVDNKSLLPSACNTAGTNLYRVPADNPYTAFDARKNCLEIYAIGLRNPWRLHFTPEGGLFIADPGHELAEELNYISPTAANSVFNFQWSCSLQNCAETVLLTQAPYFSYSRTQSDPCSAIIGGAVYQDKGSKWDGHYLLSDFCLGKVWALDYTTSKPIAYELSTSEQLINPVAFGTGSDGKMYVATYGYMSPAAIYEITASAEVTNPIGSPTPTPTPMATPTPTPDRNQIKIYIPIVYYKNQPAVQ